MGDAVNMVFGRVVVELTNLPSCATKCLSDALISPTSYSCSADINQRDADNCLLKSCPLPEALIARNVTATACELPNNDKSKQFLAVNIALAAVTIIVVLTRLGYRSLLSKRRGLFDLADWVIIAAVPIALTLLVMILVCLCREGLGQDMWAVDASNLVSFGFYLYIVEILYLAVLTLIKLTLSVFYLEIFPGKTIRILLWGTIVFHILFGVAYILKAILQCTPINYNWDKYDTRHPEAVHGHCVNINVSTWVNAAINVAMDFWLIAIPLTQVRKLKLHWKKKIGATLMFMTGLLVTAVSILRLNSLKFYNSTTNPTWDQYGVVLWSAIEINIGMICTCLPTLRLLLHRIWPRAFGTGTRSTNFTSSQRQTNPNNTVTSHLDPVAHDEYDSYSTTGLCKSNASAWGDTTDGSAVGIGIAHGGSSGNSIELEDKLAHQSTPPRSNAGSETQAHIV